MSKVSVTVLSDLIDDIRSGFASGQEDLGGIFQIRMNNITRDGALDISKRRYVPNDKKVNESTLLRAGDVVFNMTNSPDLVGKTAIFPGLREPVVYSNHFLRIRTNEKVLRSDYLARWLQLQFKRGVFKSMSRQWVNQATVSKYALLGLSIPLVSLEKQRKASAALDLVDALRAKRRAAIALLDDLTQSIFLDMFDGPASEWPVLNVEEVAAPDKGSIRTGPFGSQLLHDEFVDSGVSVLGIDNAVANEFRWGKSRFITPEKYKQLFRYTVKPGDVLITIMGTCGRCAIVPDDIPTAINTKHLCCITLDRKRCLPEFLHSYFLLHPRAQSYLHKAAKGAIMSGLNMSIIKALPLHLPPIELQEDYADRLRGIQRLKASHASHLRELDDLFGSLQQRAFRGELWDD